MVVGTQSCATPLKNNDKYDKRKAKVERLNVRAVVVTILKIPGSGREAQGGLQGARGLALQLAYTKPFAGSVSLASGCSAADSVAA